MQTFIRKKWLTFKVQNYLSYFGKFAFKNLYRILINGNLLTHVKFSRMYNYFFYIFLSTIFIRCTSRLWNSINSNRFFLIKVFFRKRIYFRNEKFKFCKVNQLKEETTLNIVFKYWVLNYQIEIVFQLYFF